MSAGKVVFLVQLDFERIRRGGFKCMEYEAQPSQTLHLNFSSTPFGVGLYHYFPGAIAPGYSQSTPFGVSN